MPYYRLPGVIPAAGGRVRDESIWMPVAAMGSSQRALLIVGFIRAGLFSYPIIASGVVRYLILFVKIVFSPADDGRGVHVHVRQRTPAEGRVCPLA
jgi:hypothetical protein